MDRPCLPMGEQLAASHASSLMCSAIFFDLDNTLHDDAGASVRAVRRTCRHLLDCDSRLDTDLLEDAYIRASTALWTDDPVRLASPVHAMRRQAWRTALGECGDHTALCDQAVACYAVARRETYALYPDTLSVLRALRPHYHLGIITNGPADLQREKIAVLGLAREVDALHLAGEVGISKPDPRIFHQALQAAGCEPSKAMMVGDSWQHDIQPARALGMRAVWITPEGNGDADALPHIGHVIDWLQRCAVSLHDFRSSHQSVPRL